MIGFLKMLTLAAAAVMATGSSLQELSTKNGCPVLEKGGRLSVNSTPNMPVRIDAGWYSFTYGGPGTSAYRSFMIRNSQVVELDLIGCFCPYNYFTVYDNGQPIFSTDVKLPEDSTFQPYPENFEEIDCTPNRTDPQSCAADQEHFGFGTSLLLPGTHNITVVVRTTPWLGGTAFLRVDTICTSAEDAFYPKPCCLTTGTCSQNIVA